MEIRKYVGSDDIGLFNMMLNEGTDWSCYYADDVIDKYKNALRNSITYVVIEDERICGYIRCKNDDGFGIYILDLLVNKDYRGRQFGRKLIEIICNLYPKDTVYVTSSADQYYEKIGCRREGSVLEIRLK